MERQCRPQRSFCALYAISQSGSINVRSTLRLYTEEAKTAETIVNRDTQMNRRRRTVDIELIILLVALVLLSIAAQWVNRNLNLTEADLPAGELRFAPSPSPEVFADLYGAPFRIDP